MLICRVYLCMRRIIPLASVTEVFPVDELLWCKDVGINKDNVYRLGSKSTKVIGRQSYHDSTSSSI